MAATDAASTPLARSAPASGTGQTRPRRRSAAARGPIALLAHQARYELLNARRNPRARFFTFFFPVAMLVIFAGVFHGTTTVDGAQVKLSRYFVAGILAMSIVLASYANLVVTIATLRASLRALLPEGSRRAQRTGRRLRRPRPAGRAVATGVEPGLFYALAIHPWDEDTHPQLTRYYRALAQRPSYAKVIADARPYRHLFPLPWPADFDRYH